MRRRRAYCPGCDAEGAAGHRCERPGCRARGLHYVPEAYYVADRERPAAARARRLGQKIGGALIVERLNRGAFGQLYLGLLLPFEMKVAIKVLEPVSSSGIADDELLEMFGREARALAALSHPHVVRLLAFDGAAHPPYLVMEYVHGGRTLRHLIEERAREGHRHLSPRHAETLLAQILWALEEAHERGIVHLDLRPDNVGLQHPAGYDDFVRLLDFGLAAHVADDPNARGFGTPKYIAPERIVGAEATGAADLYAVGVMAYELLFGVSPFGERDADEIVLAKRDPTFDPAKDLAAKGMRAPVVALFRKALAHSPTDRFADARAFAEALAAVVDLLHEESE